MIEYTLSIIKPDATKRNLTGTVNTYFEKAGLEIIAQKTLSLTKKQAEKFYEEHKARPFFSSLVDYMLSGKVVVQILKGEGAVAKNRETMGHTNPAEALPGTIRKDLGKNIEENTVHGSDSPESARREIGFFFAEYEILE